MKPKPPKIALWFFQWYCKESLQESILGDLEEQLEEDTLQYGASRAKRRFVWNVLRFFRPGISRSLIRIGYFESSGLIKHYFKTAQRNQRKDKVYSFINLFGLTLAMAVCICIYQYVSLERSYDHFHSDVDNKFRVVQSTLKCGSLISKTTETPHGLGAEALSTISGIKNIVRIRPTMADEGLVFSTQNGANVFMEYGTWYVDPAFLQMFNLPLIEGEPSLALTNPNSIVVSNSMAEKYFGSDNPIGQIVKISAGSLGGVFKVTGVLEDLPSNTHMKFDFLLPLDFLIKHYGIYTRADGWTWTNFHTYIQFEENADLTLIGSQFDNLIESHWGEELVAQNETLLTSFQPIQDIHLNDSIAGELNFNPNTLQNIRLFILIGAVIMLIAWTNAINLSSARAMRRIKEIGVRRSIGAQRNQLVSQFLTESLLLNLLAGLFAVGFSFWLISNMENLIGISLDLKEVNMVEFFLGISLIILFGALLTGLYPCFMTLKLGSSVPSKSEGSYSSKTNRLRHSLLVFQLVISLLLLFFTYLVNEQISYMSNKNLGIAMDQILIVHGPRVVLEEGDGELAKRHNRFRNELLGNSNILSITGTTNVPGSGEIWAGDIYKLGKSGHEAKEGRLILVDQYFTNTYDFEFLAGSPFRSGMRDYEAAIINEAALKQFDLGTPEEALSQSLVMIGMDTLKIQAVTKNAHWYSLHEAHAPLVFGFVDMFNAYLSIKVNPNNINESLAFIEETYRKIYPTDPYKSYFLDQKFNEQYQAERLSQKIFGIFSIISVLISCLGLFSLVSYSLHLRIKEIGVRKVLGASMESLGFMLAKSYFLVWLIASLIAIPMMIFGAMKWLEDFPFRVTLDWHLFLFPLLALAILSLMAIGHRIMKAVSVNPVDYLRNELG